MSPSPLNTEQDRPHGWRRSVVTVFCIMAWRNVWRNPLRSLLTVSALAGGMIVLIFYAALMNGMTQHMVAFATEISTGHLQVHRAAYYDEQDWYATIPWQWLPQLEKANPGLQFAPRAYGAGLASSADASLGVSIQAIVFEKEAQTTRFLEHLRQGDLLGFHSAAGSSNVAATHDAPVALGHHLARQLNIAVHDEIVLMTQALDGSIGNDIYRVAAIFKPISPTFDRSGVVMAMTDFEVLMALSDGFHELVVKTQEPNSVALTAKALERDLENLSGAAPLDALGGAIEVRTWKTLVPMVGEMLALSGAMMFMVGGVLVGLAALGMVNTMLMAMHERVHELGILRALGLRAGAVCLLVLLEAFFLGITATVLGAGLGVLVTLYFSKTGIDFSEALPEGYDWGGMVFEPVMQVSLDTSIIIPAGLLMVGLTLLAVVLPARRVLKRAPVEMLA